MKKILLPAIVVFLGIWLFTPSPVLAVGKAFSRAAYNPDKNNFLIVWADARRYNSNVYEAECYNKPGCDNAIYGAFLDKDLKQIGGDFPIADNQYKDETYPDVVYNPKRQEFLVVYQRCDGECDYNQYPEWNIYASRVKDDGRIIGTYPVYTDIYKQWEPTVAYDSINNRYLVAFMDLLDSSAVAKDIKVQLLSAEGEKIGPSFFISVDESGGRLLGFQERPVVVFIPKEKVYFLVWEDHQNKSVAGTILNADGEFVTSPKNFFFGAGTGDKYYPQIAYNEFNREIWVVWQNNKTDIRTVEAQRVSIFGQPVGNQIMLDDNAGKSSSNPPDSPPRPGIECDPLNGSCLITWMDSNSIDWCFQIRIFNQKGELVFQEKGVASNGDRSTVVFNDQERFFLILRNRDIFTSDRPELFWAHKIAALPAAEPTSLDLNADGKIDEVDLSLLLREWGLPFDQEDLEMVFLNWRPVSD